jgi:hypothetical protein
MNHLNKLLQWDGRGLYTEEEGVNWEGAQQSESLVYKWSGGLGVGGGGGVVYVRWENESPTLSPSPSPHPHPRQSLSVSSTNTVCPLFEKYPSLPSPSLSSTS